MASNAAGTSAAASAAGQATSAQQAAVFVPSEPVPSDAVQVQGPNFDQPQDVASLLSSLATVGFQATELGRAIEVVNQMRAWRLSDEPVQADVESDEYLDEEVRSSTRCTIFLGYTSNLISSGLRDVIRYLVQHKHVSALVTTAGGIEEDLIKCLGPTYLGSFAMDGAGLRKRGLNRIGNLIVPNDNYCKFEDWVMPILDAMRKEQGDHVDNVWTPSLICRRLGLEINDPSSVLYWAAKNDIPVFCPALTDGSLGDMLYFHSYKSPGLVVDLVKDIRRLNDMSVKAKKAGAIILGGGVCKHQIANAMLFRNGADYAVYINTGQEFDGSDSGARPDEAVSWGKIKSAERGGQAVKVSCDASIAFPLLVAGTFARGS